MFIYYSKEKDFFSVEISINDEEEGHKLYSLLAKNNIKINKFEIKKPSLHDIFIEKVGASK